MDESVAPATVVGAVGLTKTFRDFWNRPKACAVNDIDFEVREGEVVGLLGPNGSGKSTTVKMMLGLLYPSAGRLTVFGKSPRSVSIKRRIGYLPEETYLYKYLTAYETLDFFASLFQLSAKERKTRCEQLLDMVGLAHARNRPVGEFSKGMARRIGLAQAMINDPALLILDEPTSGLDPIGCREVKDLIKLMKKRGKTVVVTSHLLSDVEEVCDRIILLYGGRIRAQGPLNELLSIRASQTITTPELPPEVLKKVLAELRLACPNGEIEVAHPRMSLEDFFLDIVNRAKRESLETSGAASGGNIADYLSDGGDAEEERDAEKRLGAILGEEKAAAPVLENDSDEIKEAERRKQDELFAALNESSAPQKTSASESSAEEERRMLDEANEKLRDIFGKD